MSIPADIQKAAEIAVFAFEARIQGGEFSEPDGSQARDALKAAIGEAVNTERERCASYHDDMAAQQEGFRFDAKGDLIEHHAKMVRFHQSSAAAIRNPSGA